MYTHFVRTNRLYLIVTHYHTARLIVRTLCTATLYTHFVRTNK